MPVDFSSHRDCTYVCLTGHGDISDAELIAALQLMYANEEDTKRHRCALMDFSRSSNVDVSSEGIREAARLNLAASKLMAPGVAVAIVVSKPLTYGLGRMWQSYADNTGWTTSVFEDLDEAKSWLEGSLQQGLEETD